VLAQKRVGFASLDVERDVVDGHRRAESLADAACRDGRGSMFGPAYGRDGLDDGQRKHLRSIDASCAEISRRWVKARVPIPPPIALPSPPTSGDERLRTCKHAADILSFQAARRVQRTIRVPAFRRKRSRRTSRDLRPATA